MVKKSNKPEVWMYLTQREAYGFHSVIVHFKCWQKNESTGQFDFRSSGDALKFEGLYDFDLEANFGKSSSTAYCHDETHCTAHKPSTRTMVRMVRFMTKIDAAISARQRELNDYSFTTTIGALVRFFDVKRMIVSESVSHDNNVRRETVHINSDLFVSKAALLEEQMVARYGMQKETVA